MKTENENNYSEERPEVNQPITSEIDLYFRQSLSGIERQPSPKSWSRIAEKLPLHLRLRNQLLWLSRIAAVLVIFMCITIIWKDQHYKPIQHLSFDAVTIDNPTVVTAQKPMLQKEEPEPGSSLASGIPYPSKDIDVLLKLITAEDELDQKINEEIIAKALEPLQQLPIEGLVVNIPAKSKIAIPPPSFSDDLQISITLQVVEEYEVEELLRKYDTQNF